MTSLRLEGYTDEPRSMHHPDKWHRQWRSSSSGHKAPSGDGTPSCSTKVCSVAGISRKLQGLCCNFFSFGVFSALVLDIWSFLPFFLHLWLMMMWLGSPFNPSYIYCSEGTTIIADHIKKGCQTLRRRVQKGKDRLMHNYH